MKAGDMTGADGVIAECLAIVDRCGGATGTGRYADGYRAAAADIRAFIQARFAGQPVASWERDLRDVEVEARTLSRVIALLRREQTLTSSATVRRALTDLIIAIDDVETEEPSREIQRDTG
jgi:hypothetical protein